MLYEVITIEIQLPHMVMVDKRRDELSAMCAAGFMSENLFARNKQIKCVFRANVTTHSVSSQGVPRRHCARNDVVV